MNVADGMHAWSESWDKNLRDILTVENEIAARWWKPEGTTA